MASILTVAFICACALVCSGAQYDQYPYNGHNPEVDRGQYKPSVPGKYYPDYHNQDYYGGNDRRYRRSVPSNNDGSYPSHYPPYPTGYPAYPTGYLSNSKYPTYHRYPARNY